MQGTSELCITCVLLALKTQRGLNNMRSLNASAKSTVHPFSWRENKGMEQAFLAKGYCLYNNKSSFPVMKEKFPVEVSLVLIMYTFEVKSSNLICLGNAILFTLEM